MKAASIILILAAATAAQLIFPEVRAMARTTGVASGLPVEGRLPSFAGATGWLNSKPLMPADLKGKVVVVEFWTYSCVNWLRTEPYVRAWAEKYKDHGLVVIGVHTPEFGFEKNLDNIRWGATNYRVNYPIAIDSDYGVWRAFDNRYWPAIYFIDAEGQIRHHQFGEGDYDKSERVIQNLLDEAGIAGFDRGLVSLDPTGADAAADWENLGTGETYVGYGRGENFISPGGVVADRPSLYAALPRPDLNQWGLAGTWRIGRESASLGGASGKIVFRFHARDVNLVMGPSSPGSLVRYRVRLDGQPPGPNAGLDVDKDGNGVVREQRLYQLVRQQDSSVDATVEIEFLDPGVEAFVFTFG